MENASKALIIAGAILVSILLIAVGTMLLSNAQGIFNRGGQVFSAQEKEAFNAPFLAYEGKQSGSNVRALASKIANYNIDAEDDQKIAFKCESYDDKVEPSTLSSARERVKAGSSYMVSFEYNDAGLVNKVIAQ